MKEIEILNAQEHRKKGQKGNACGPLCSEGKSAAQN